MRTAAVSELKAKLSEYLRIVEKGEDVMVLSHGRPVAKLVRIEPRKDLSHEEWVAELIRTGKARGPRGKLPADFWDRPRFEDPDGLLLKALLDERREGR